MWGDPGRVKGAAQLLASRWQPHCRSGLPQEAKPLGMDLSPGAGLSLEFSGCPRAAAPLSHQATSALALAVKGWQGQPQPQPPLQDICRLLGETLLRDLGVTQLLPICSTVGSFLSLALSLAHPHLRSGSGFYFQDTERIRWNILWPVAGAQQMGATISPHLTSWMSSETLRETTYNKTNLT